MIFLKKKKKILKIHKINLGRTCFERVGHKSETKNIFFRSNQHVHHLIGCSKKKKILPTYTISKKFVTGNIQLIFLGPTVKGGSEVQNVKKFNF